MPDLFESYSPSINAPASSFQAVSPSDTVDLPFVTRALWTGSGGTLVVQDMSGATSTFTNVPPGIILPIRVKRVLATGTNIAQGLLALW